MNPNGPIQDPNLRALLNAHRDEIFASLNAVQTGTIVSFDVVGGAPIAVVSINAKRVVYNQPQTLDGRLQATPTLVDYPVLADVPVLFPSGGGAHLTFPIKAGDQCLLLFNDRDLDAWFAAGGANPPNSSRMHDLSDAVAIVGLFGRANSIGAFDLDDVVLAFGGSTISIAPNGFVSINSAAGVVVQSGGAEFALAGGKATVKNATDSLATALDALCTALSTWVNTGGSTPNPTTVAAIAAVKAQLDALLAP